MKRSYQNELYELRKWIDESSICLSSQIPLPYYPEQIERVRHQIAVIGLGIQSEHPFYASVLPDISVRLFQRNSFGVIALNPSAFGELALVTRHIEAEPVVTPFWSTIHERISRISADLYKDGHYAAAAEKAIKEVETRLREKFAELKPNTTVPKEVTAIISALLTDKGLFNFCDTSTISGMNYRRGIRLLFEGAIAAYRNPSAHANLEVGKHKALEQIMLASQLMFVLDLPQLEMNEGSPR